MSVDTGGWGNEPSVLIFASHAGGMAEARMAAESVGARVIGAESIDGAMERLQRQVSVDAVVIELDEASLDGSDRLLDWANHAVRGGEAAVIVAMPQAVVDDVYARIDAPQVMLLVEPAAGDRAAALGLALAERQQRLHDHGIEADAERLRRLSEEVARIAGALAELSTSGRSLGHTPRGVPALGEPQLDASAVRGLIRVRRLRDQFFQGTVRRSGLGHVAGPDGGTVGTEPGGGLQPVHRRRRARDDRAPLDPDTHRTWTLRPNRRSRGWPANLHRTVRRSL